MPIVTLRDWDQSGQMTATDNPPSKSQDALAALAQVVKAYKTYKTNSDTKKAQNAYRDAAIAAMGQPGNESSFEYDPSKGYTAKVQPKKADADTSNAQMRREVFKNQFGYDPITGEKVANPVKPKFGYSNDILAQILGGGGLNDDASVPSLDVPSNDAKFLDPIDQDAQAAIAAGADPAAVKARAAQLKAARDKTAPNGTV